MTDVLGHAWAFGTLLLHARQLVIGRYIADAVCPSQRLVIEGDGGVHANRVSLDAIRDAHLQRPNPSWATKAKRRLPPWKPAPLVARSLSSLSCS